MTALLALCAVGCGAGGPGSAPGSSQGEERGERQLPLLEYSSVGGIAGVERRLVVFPDGRARTIVREEWLESRLEPVVLTALQQVLGPEPFAYVHTPVGADLFETSYVYRPGGRQPPPVERLGQRPRRPSRRGEELVDLLLNRLDHLVIYRKPEGEGAVELTVRQSGEVRLARIRPPRMRGLEPEEELLGSSIELERDELERLRGLLTDVDFPRQVYDPQRGRRTDRAQLVHRFLVLEANSQRELTVTSDLIEQLEEIAGRMESAPSPPTSTDRPSPPASTGERAPEDSGSFLVEPDPLRPHRRRAR